MLRGEVWWASLPDPIGSEPGYRRPVLVVQSDAFSRSRIQTVMIIPLTSNLSLAGAPGNVRLPPRATGLPKESVAVASQVATVDKVLLSERVSELPPELMELVDDGLRLALSL